MSNNGCAKEYLNTIYLPLDFVYYIVFEKIKKLRADLFLLFCSCSTMNYLEIAMIEIEPLIKPRKGMRILDKKKKNKKISIPFHTKKIHFLLHYFIENVRDIKKGDAISRCHTKKKKK